MWHVYIVRCRDGSLYTGITNDLRARLDAHNAGRGAKYTRWRLPVSLVHAERFRDQGAALSRELAIKRLDRRRKLALIAER
ncbi:GIY-YIG nuclease family protein [bacterium]|nr:GIY-YIG nuclease family protein [bacterium]